MYFKFYYLNNVRFYLRDMLGNYPVGLSVIKLHPRLSEKVVTRQTKMCVEGFPRCANSFLYEIIAARMPGLHVAHHVHVVAQIHLSVRYGVPIVIVIRDPLDAVSSLLAVSDCNFSAGLAIDAYIHFYNSIEQYADLLYIADFPRITKDTLSVLKEIDAKFGSTLSLNGFAELDRTVAMEHLVKKNRERKQPANLVAVPHEKKSEANKLARELVIDHPRLKIAQSVYDKWKSMV